MTVQIINADCLEALREMPEASVHCCVTSPPYFGLRDYGHEGQIGLEESPDAFVARLVEVFREVRRVLRDDGTLWLNIGDSYAGNRRGSEGDCVGLDGSRRNQAASRAAQRTTASRRRDNHPIPRNDRAFSGIKNKDLIGIPWMVAFALRADGWYLRQEIIWSKPNPMPESVRDRCTKSHEQLFLLSKSPRYYFDAEAIAEPATKAGQVIHSYSSGAKDRQDVTDTNDRRTRIGLSNWNQPCPETRNKRSVWTVSTKPFSGAHFATFPPALIEPCILAGCPEGGTVLDPFGGAGTTGLVADRLYRNAVLIEISESYAALARQRITEDCPLFAEPAA
ncbi:DNA-methyltransferase [Algiphilus sp.]|uniref:DNA-methyltransferase n=1 Tax=Algiphilus sp. TaxID=1872431 RepID=UPI003CCBA649